MAATGYSPIQLYYSTTASAAPTAGNLASGELAINITDGKLYYKDNAGAVQLLSTSTTATGTANGVLYLNGSKVATSGSALTFNGTNLGVGAASASGYGRLQVRNGFAYINEDGSDTHQLYLRSYYGSAGAAIQVGSADPLLFVLSSGEQMRLTSTGLGIGTSSPSYKLEIYDATNPRFSLNTGASGNSELRFSTPSSGYQGLITYSAASNFMAFYTSATERMRLNTSGNLGLGVTPSAWNNSIKALQVNNAALASFTNGGNVQTWLANNAYYDNATGWLYKNSSVGAALYAQSFNGSHNWNIAPSGTAGNAITFTQAMTLDASGNLLVGTTSSTQKVTSSANAADGTTGYAGAFHAYKGATGDAWIQLGGARSDGLGSGRVSYVDARAGGGAGATLGFSTDGTERARIDSSGNLLVNTTSQIVGGEKLAVVGGSGSLAIGVQATGSGGVGISIYGGNASGASTNTMINFLNSAGSSVGSIVSNGTLTTYNTTSDQRLKENIADADSASALIDSLQVRKFDWKADGNHQRYGFVAQELVTVAPEAVHQPADPEEMMAVDYSKLVPMLVKEIQSLRKRLADAGIA